MAELVARQVLNDCIRAHNQLDAEETDPDEWRVKWIGALALLRMVGSVLHKVDGKRADVSAIQKLMYSEWKSDAPEHIIFRDFVLRHRNLALKEYEVFVWEGPDISLTTSNGEVFALPSDLFRPLTEGYGQGEDARDIYLQAVTWWDRQLSIIEEALR